MNTKMKLSFFKNSKLKFQPNNVIDRNGYESVSNFFS